MIKFNKGDKVRRVGEVLLGSLNCMNEEQRRDITENTVFTVGKNTSTYDDWIQLVEITNSGHSLGLWNIDGFELVKEDKPEAPSRDSMVKTTYNIKYPMLSTSGQKYMSLTEEELINLYSDIKDVLGNKV